jgi:hypothetical protein
MCGDPGWDGLFITEKGESKEVNTEAGFLPTLPVSRKDWKCGDAEEEVYKETGIYKERLLHSPNLVRNDVYTAHAIANAMTLSRPM